MEYNASLIYQGITQVVAPGDVTLLVAGGLLVLLGILLLFVLKRVLENLVIGLLGFLVLKYVVGVNIPLLPGLLIALLFGLGGLGVLLILHFFGLL